MSRRLRRYWVLLPVLASMATQCDETPRGAFPTLVTSVELVLTSIPAVPPTDPAREAVFLDCLQRMNGLPNHVRPSWRSNDVILLTETATDSNAWAASFFDVPVDFSNTMTVHDTNECARDPEGHGHVVIGVTVNGTVVDRAIGMNNTLVFEVSADGAVTLPAVTTSAGP